MQHQMPSMDDLQLANKAVTIIRKSLDQSISLSELSKKLNTTPGKLKLLFEHFYMGQSIREMQLYMRIEQAMILMYIEKMPTELVISHIGFKSIDGFTRAFKKLLRQTPTQWMNSLTNRIPM